MERDSREMGIDEKRVVIDGGKLRVDLLNMYLNFRSFRKYVVITAIGVDNSSALFSRQGRLNVKSYRGVMF